MPELLQIGSATNEMIDRMSAAFTVHRASDQPDLAGWLTARGDKVAYVQTDGQGVTPDIMAALTNLKMISSYGVGYDRIDAREARRRGIMVTHTPNVLNEEVATTAVLLMLACYRELLRDDAWVRSGNWQAKGNSPLTRSAENQTIGILGMGRIGQAIAAKLAPWKPTILYHTRREKDVPYQYVGNLAELAEKSDVLIVITPGGAATHHIVSAEVMNALGPEGTLINVARGTVIDEEAMIAALSEGRLGWAGLDVFENEPKVPQALRDLKNVTLLPHVGSATHETRAAMGKLTVDNLLSHLKDGTVITPVPECQ